MSVLAWDRYSYYGIHYVFTFTDIIVTHSSGHEVLTMRFMLSMRTPSHRINITAPDIPLLVTKSDPAPAGNTACIHIGGDVVQSIRALNGTLIKNIADVYRLIPTSDKLLNAMCQIEGTIRAEMW